MKGLMYRRALRYYRITLYWKGHHKIKREMNSKEFCTLYIGSNRIGL
jgi:hypothetical protein